MGHGNKIQPQKLSQGLHTRMLTIAAARRLKTKPPPPVLLRLPADTPEPTAVNDPIQKRQQNGNGRIVETPVKLLWPARMNRLAVGTAEPLHPQSKSEPLKIPPHIPVAPKPSAFTLRTPLRPRPRIILPLPNKPLYIDSKMEYQ
jgi:hypothetical protein